MCCMTNRFWQVVCPTILYYFLCSVDLVVKLIAACVAYHPYSVACFLVYLMTLCQLHKLYCLEWRGGSYNVEGSRHTVLCLLFRHLHTATEVNHGLFKQSLLVRTDSVKHGNVCCNEQGRNPSSDATRCCFGQEIPGILCDLKVNCRFRNCLSLVLILNPLHKLSFS